MSKRLPEQKLWDDVREAMGGRWFARRIEDRLGEGLPDVWFIGNKRRGAWLENKQMPTLPLEDRIFDIPHFTPAQRAFGLQCMAHGGQTAWFLMTRLGDVDHLHRATVIDMLGEVSYRVFRAKAAWVGRVTPESGDKIAHALLR